MNEIQGLEFSALTHQYFLNGKELISVTKVFEKVGVTDFSRVPFDVIEPARQFGDVVHDMAAMFGNEVLDEDTVDLEYEGFLESIRSFFKDHVKKILAIEYKVCNVVHHYAGTLDILYLNKKKELCLDDWKTPKHEQKASKWQTVAYFKALPKEICEVKRRHAVHLRADGTYEMFEHKNPIRRDFDDFLTFLRCAILLQNNKLGR